MTTQHAPIDDLIRELLERRAAAAQPYGLLDEIVRSAASTPQVRGRKAWSFWTPPTSLSSLAGIAAIVVALIGAVVVAPRFLGSGASDVPGLYPTIVAAGQDAPTLPAGRYLTAAFDPRLSFAVPDHLWAPGADVPRLLWLRARFPGAPDFAFDGLTLVTITNVYDDPCTRGPAENVAWDPSSGPDGFVDWLEQHLGGDLGPRTPVTLLGAPGVQVEFTAEDMTYCSQGRVAITDIGQAAPFVNHESGVTVRYAVIALRDEIVLVDTEAAGGAGRDAVWAAADAVLESIEIAP
jgi:hypothetical protein